MMQEINVKLDVFEGPLDLLLHLIQKLEIDIYDIPIADVTKQYMDYIHTMQHLELEIAGEYLLMAATLMAIKSQMLLPKPEIIYDVEEDFEEDPREALVNQLLEYRKYKYAAEKLSVKESERNLHYTREPSLLEEYEEEQTPLPAGKFNTIDLFLAVHEILERQRKQNPLEKTISMEDVTVDEKIHDIQQILAALPVGTGQRFDDLFIDSSKNEIVTTFLALLELIRKGYAKVQQPGNYQQIMIFAVEEQKDE